MEVYTDIADLFVVGVAQLNAVGLKSGVDIGDDVAQLLGVIEKGENR